jgi:hypothetical protein
VTYENSWPSEESHAHVEQSRAAATGCCDPYCGNPYHIHDKVIGELFVHPDGVIETGLSAGWLAPTQKLVRTADGEITVVPKAVSRKFPFEWLRLWGKAPRGYVGDWPPAKPS